MRKKHEPKYNRNELRNKFKEELGTIRSLEGQIKKVKKMNLPDKKKETIIEQLKLQWSVSEFTLESEGFDWKAVEGIGYCIAMTILEYENQNKDE